VRRSRTRREPRDPFDLFPVGRTRSPQASSTRSAGVSTSGFEPLTAPRGRCRDRSESIGPRPRSPVASSTSSKALARTKTGLAATTGPSSAARYDRSGRRPGGANERPNDLRPRPRLVARAMTTPLTGGSISLIAAMPTWSELARWRGSGLRTRRSLSQSMPSSISCCALPKDDDDLVRYRPPEPRRERAQAADDPRNWASRLGDPKRDDAAGRQDESGDGHPAAAVGVAGCVVPDSRGWPRSRLRRPDRASASGPEKAGHTAGP